MDAMHEYRSPVPTLARVGRFIWALKVPIGGLVSLIVGALVLGPRVKPNDSVVEQWICGAGWVILGWMILAAIVIIILEIAPELDRLWKNTK